MANSGLLLPTLKARRSLERSLAHLPTAAPTPMAPRRAGLLLLLLLALLAPKTQCFQVLVDLNAFSPAELARVPNEFP